MDDRSEIFSASVGDVFTFLTTEIRKNDVCRWTTDWLTLLAAKLRAVGGIDNFRAVVGIDDAGAVVGIDDSGG